MQRKPATSGTPPKTRRPLASCWPTKLSSAHRPPGKARPIELLQPFVQLGRDTHRLSEVERAGSPSARWLHHKVPTGKVMGLTSRGWQRGAAQDGGWVGTNWPRASELLRDMEALTADS